MEFIVFFLLLIVPGIFADRIYNIVSRWRETSNAYTSLIFALIIYIINIFWLFVFKGILTFTALIAAFDCLQFQRRYAIFSLILAAILGTVVGFIRKFFFWIRR
ncbi:hypothetical protein [Anaerocolumna cellulosilytica]|uniref:hypothetical protein n=1 Tax=Anaerocolumna cellulosilytica TaxID=433286 RepID=UPI00160707B5|nr:hypothetical protein [Anaerocolumna cellulosilytica]MBB5194111.1 glucan phosphoethanolaminetransferase (alkaline phosphatase superfamily) [Anaerocolumna cellulosilytica]